MSGPIRIVLVSPILAVRAGLRIMLESNAAGAFSAPAAIRVIWETANLADLEEVPHGADVLLLAADDFTKLDLKRAITLIEGPIAILLLASDPGLARRLVGLPLRAWGVLELDASAEELVAAVYALHEGLLVGKPSLMEPLFPHLLSNGGPEVVPLAEPLTERESGVLQLLAQGLANKQIAAALHISEHTVKFHVSAIYSKLGATNRAEAVRLGVQRGLVLL